MLLLKKKDDFWEVQKNDKKPKKGKKTKATDFLDYIKDKGITFKIHYEGEIQKTQFLNPKSTPQTEKELSKINSQQKNLNIRNNSNSSKDNSLDNAISNKSSKLINIIDLFLHKFNRQSRYFLLLYIFHRLSVYILVNPFLDTHFVSVPVGIVCQKIDPWGEGLAGVAGTSGWYICFQTIKVRF